MPQVAISPQLALTLTPEQWQPIESAVFAGRKIEAIKLIREILPDAGLAEAKQYVENIEAGLRQLQPERFAPSAGKSGCFSVMAVVGLLVSATLVTVYILLS